MKKVKVILFILAVIGIFGFVLYTNKKKIDANAEVKVEQKNIPVTTVAAAVTSLSESMSSVGTFEPYKEITLLSEVQGKVIKVGIEEGDFVRAGSLLAQTDNELLRAELMAAEAAYESAKKNKIRYENLSKGNATTEVRVEESDLALKNALARLMTIKKQIRNTTITAPIAGTITERSFEYGSVILPGAKLAQITDISRVKLRLNVPEKDILNYKNGDKVAIQADVYPGVAFEGTVTLVGVKSDNAHNYPVEILVANNEKHPLRAGMYGRTAGDNQVKSAALAIPRVALVGSIKNPQVFVIENNRAILKNIGVGITSNDKIEVMAGLREGEQVVTSGQINLEEGSVVRIVK